MKGETRSISGHHLPLSPDLIQPVLPLIINVSTQSRVEGGVWGGGVHAAGSYLRIKLFVLALSLPLFVLNSVSLLCSTLLLPFSRHVSSQFSSVQRLFISVTNPVVKCQLRERQCDDGTSANHRNLSTTS